MNDPAISVLVVDDDPEILALLSQYLRGYSIQATGVADGVAMREAWASQSFDLVILDLMLPGEDGLSLCRYVRSQGETPVIMLTARGESTDRVVGLELGADDYVVKPFDPRELVARIHTILRRSHRRVVSSMAEQDAHFSGWSLNHLKRQVTTPAQLLVPLSNAEYRLLCAFLERPQRILTREQLLDAARGRATEAFDRSIDLLVSRLRQKLGDDPKAPCLLKTVRGEGYVLDSQVSV